MLVSAVATIGIVAFPASARADGVYAAKMIERDGSGWKHKLVLYTRGVKAPKKGAVYASEPSQQGKLPTAKFVRPGTWSMPPSTAKRRRVINALSLGIRAAEDPEVYAFGGDSSEPIPVDVIALRAFNERFLRD
jgi:hypothetical protein